MRTHKPAIDENESRQEVGDKGIDLLGLDDYEAPLVPQERLELVSRCFGVLF